MILAFTPKTDRQRRAWIRWCEVEYGLARVDYRSKGRTRRQIDRFYDAAERLHEARDAAYDVPADPLDPGAG